MAKIKLSIEEKLAKASQEAMAAYLENMKSNYGPLAAMASQIFYGALGLEVSPWGEVRGNAGAKGLSPELQSLLESRSKELRDTLFEGINTLEVEPKLLRSLKSFYKKKVTEELEKRLYERACEMARERAEQLLREGLERELDNVL